MQDTPPQNNKSSWKIISDTPDVQVKTPDKEQIIKKIK